MQPRNQPLKKYGRILWQSASALMALACVGLAVQLWLAAKWEARDAFESGRRLLIAIETGEVEGRILTLDAPATAAPTSVPAPEQEAPPLPEGEAGVAPAEAPAAPPPPAGEEVALPPATPMPGVNPALVERTPDGDLPVIGSDGTKPWRYYSKPFERKRNQPMVAVIVSGLGVNREVTEAALKLHEYVTVSFSPYARDITSWHAAIRASGHEIMIDVPLQPADYPLTDPGPYGLILEKGDVEATRRLQWMMTRFPTSIGFLTPQNESFTANDEAFKLLLHLAANRGLMLVLGKEPPRKETKDILDAGHTASAIARVLIDEEQSEIAIQARLSQLEEEARKYGYAIGIAQPYPITVAALRAWSQSLAEKGVILVPVSAIVKLHFS